MFEAVTGFVDFGSKPQSNVINSDDIYHMRTDENRVVSIFM